MNFHINQITKFSFICALLVAFCCVQSLTTRCQAGRINRQLSVNSEVKVKAVNLGGWLVTEGWIKPSLFDGIPQKDLLDGTQIQLNSVTTGKFVSAEKGGGANLVANRPDASGWETFKLWRIDENTFNFRVFSDQFMGVQAGDSTSGSAVVAEANTPGNSERFQIVRNSDDPHRVRIKQVDGPFLQAKTESEVTADYTGDDGWGDDNPSVFVMKIVKTLQGEYQVTNGYGQERAQQVMMDHWDTFITEDDFSFISEKGINAVRIPVGWWIAFDPTPLPFVGGSLQTLDKAFTWANKYNIRVIIDLHAAPGSQNGNEHSGTRDGSLKWGKTKDTIQKSIDVINFLAERYKDDPKLYAIELINEPHAPDVPLDTLLSYYKSGYVAVRSHSSTAYVVMSNRLGNSVDPKELFDLASGLPLTVVDVHYYNLYSNEFVGKSAQWNIDYINNKRSSDLSYITTPDGPLTFVGEWVAEWNASNATNEDYINFANAQLQVYGGASFGWAYWTLKTSTNDQQGQQHWSLSRLESQPKATKIRINIQIIRISRLYNDQAKLDLQENITHSNIKIGVQSSVGIFWGKRFPYLTATPKMFNPLTWTELIRKEF